MSVLNNLTNTSKSVKLLFVSFLGYIILAFIARIFFFFFFFFFLQQILKAHTIYDVCVRHQTHASAAYGNLQNTYYSHCKPNFIHFNVILVWLLRNQYILENTGTEQWKQMLQNVNLAFSWAATFVYLISAMLKDVSGLRKFYAYDLKIRAQLFKASLA